MSFSVFWVDLHPNPASLLAGWTGLLARWANIMVVMVLIGACATIKTIKILSCGFVVLGPRVGLPFLSLCLRVSYSFHSWRHSQAVDKRNPAPSKKPRNDSNPFACYLVSVLHHLEKVPSKHSDTHTHTQTPLEFVRYTERFFIDQQHVYPGWANPLFQHVDLLTQLLFKQSLCGFLDRTRGGLS